MLRRGEKIHNQKINPTKRTKGSSLLLIPAVLKRNACFHPVLVSNRPWNVQVSDPKASLLFQYFLKHFLELNLGLNPVGSLEPNEISLPLSFLTWGRCVLPHLSTSLCKRNRSPKDSWKCWCIIPLPCLFLEDPGASRLCPRENSLSIWNAADVRNCWAGAGDLPREGGGTRL